MTDPIRSPPNARTPTDGSVTQGATTKVSDSSPVGSVRSSTNWADISLSVQPTIDAVAVSGGLSHHPATAIRIDDDLYLSPSGYFVSRPGQMNPVSPAENGEVLSRTSSLLEQGIELFRGAEITLAHKQGAFNALTEAFEASLHPELFNGNADQALQTRASAAPLLLDLATSLNPEVPEQRALIDQVMAKYFSAIESEPHGLLRSFMLFDLDRAKAKLPADLHLQINLLMQKIAPLSPPYEEWFRGGGKKIKFEYYTGPEFWEADLDYLTQEGFTRVDNRDGTVTMKKAYQRERQLNDGTVQRFSTEVEMRVHNGTAGLFEAMNDPTVAGIIYSGHAHYGNEIPRHLPGSPSMVGAKVFLSLQCGGKGLHNALLAKFPDLQVVSSKNASFPIDDRRMLMNTLGGFAERLPWSQISQRNASRVSRNYYFPSDTLFTRRSIDLDADGRADAWDRVFNVNPFQPQASIDEQLKPCDPGRPAESLSGAALTGAVIRFWRAAGYNYWAKPLQNHGVLGGGYYPASRNDPLFKFTNVTAEDGATIVNVQMNPNYAHASEEVLGAALHYELGRRQAEQNGLSRSDAKAVGLLMAAKAIEMDASYNNVAAWKALLSFEGLPPEIDFYSVMAANEEDVNYPAGGKKGLELLNQRLFDLNVTL